jgi:hypothetical protein
MFKVASAASLLPRIRHIHRIPVPIPIPAQRERRIRVPLKRIQAQPRTDAGVMCYGSETEG